MSTCVKQSLFILKFLVGHRIVKKTRLGVTEMWGMGGMWGGVVEWKEANYIRKEKKSTNMLTS